MLKWQTSVWSLQLCHCVFAVRIFYNCFHSVLGSIWTPAHTIVPTRSRKSMNNESKVTQTTALCGAVSWTCWHDVLLWICVMNMPTWRALCGAVTWTCLHEVFCGDVSWTFRHDVNCVELCHEHADNLLLWSCVMNIEHILQEILSVRNNAHASNFDITSGIRRVGFVYFCELRVHLGK